MGGTLTKNWRVDAGDGKEDIHIVQLRHHTFSGRRLVLVDGKTTMNSQKFLDDGDVIPIQIGNKQGEIYITMGNVDFEYQFIWEGEEITDMTSSVQEYEDLKMRVSIPRADVARDGDGNVDAVYYNVLVETESDSYTLRKRFSDFDALDGVIRSAFFGNHLLSNLPDLPPKYFKWMYDHFDPSFIDERRLQLEVYVRKLIQTPKVGTNPDFVAFFSPKRGRRPAAAAEDKGDGKIIDE